MNPSVMSPREIDTILADLWESESVIRMRIVSAQQRIARIHADLEHPTRKFRISPSSLAIVEKELAEKELALSENKAQAAPYEAEYQARPWNRYFLVKNANGHVHRGMNCTSCFPTTEYGWLTDLSDCDEEAMVEVYGEKACTVCFPNAPVHPAFIRSAAQREAAERAKAASTCKGGNHSYGFRKRYETCLECGAFASVTPSGGLRAHKRQEG